MNTDERIAEILDAVDKKDADKKIIEEWGENHLTDDLTDIAKLDPRNRT